MRVLFDTNVILDALMARVPHSASAVELLDRVARRELDALMGATSVTTIYYLAEKVGGAVTARKQISDLLSIFDVAPVTGRVVTAALSMRFKDYEDAVLHEAARHAGATGIVTRNTKDFTASRLKCYQPSELATLLRATGPATLRP